MIAGRRSTAARLEEFIRFASPAIAASAANGVELREHAVQISTLKETLRDNDIGVHEGFVQLRELMEESIALQRKTNGRVTDLEKQQVAEEAVRAATAKFVEEAREREAIHVAKGSWVRPAIVSIAVAAISLAGAIVFG